MWVTMEQQRIVASIQLHRKSLLNESIPMMQNALESPIIYKGCPYYSPKKKKKNK